MSAIALIREADLKRMAKIAREGGVRVEIEIDGKLIRVAPDIPDINRGQKDTLPDDFAL